MENKITSKSHLHNELKKSNIEICLSRSLGPNSFNLINESWGNFTINCKQSVTYEQVRDFKSKYSNLSISINH